MTIDTHHHILPDFFWQATENVHAPIGGLAPLRWSRETALSFMDDAGIDVAKVSESFGGGGHRLASGAVVDGTMEQVRAKVLAAVHTALVGACRETASGSS